MVCQMFARDVQEPLSPVRESPESVARHGVGWGMGDPHSWWIGWQPSAQKEGSRNFRRFRDARAGSFGRCQEANGGGDSFEQANWEFGWKGRRKSESASCNFPTKAEARGTPAGALGGMLPPNTATPRVLFRHECSIRRKG